MAHLRIYPPCIHCGAQRDSAGRPTAKKEMNGWANDGEIPVYYLKCLNCGEHWLAFVGSLPAHASLSALDEMLRKRLRESKRKKYGYASTGSEHRTRRDKRFESDRIEAVIRILPGRIGAALGKKLGRTKTTAPWRETTEEIA